MSFRTGSFVPMQVALSQVNCGHVLSSSLSNSPIYLGVVLVSIAVQLTRSFSQTWWVDFEHDSIAKLLFNITLSINCYLFINGEILKLFYKE